MNELQKGLLKHLIFDVFNAAAGIMERMVMIRIDSPDVVKETRSFLSEKFSAYALLKDNPKIDDALETMANEMARDDRKEDTDIMDFLTENAEIMLEAGQIDAENAAEQMLELLSSYANSSSHSHHFH